MKLKMAIPGVLLLACVLLFAPGTQAANAQTAGLQSAGLQTAAGNLNLLLSKTRVKVGDLLTVDIQVKGAPTIYGADVRLVFDPAYLQVTDQDTKTAGVQVVNGSFISAKKSFFLQNQVKNDEGAVDYALTLLNPAPAVQGDGQLFRVVFRAVKGGQTTIQIAEGQYGTRTGEVLTPRLGSASVQINDNRSPAAAAPTGDSSAVSPELTPELVVLPFGITMPQRTARAAGFAGAGLLGMGLAIFRLKARLG